MLLALQKAEVKTVPILNSSQYQVTNEGLAHLVPTAVEPSKEKP